jgi:hypothetical protein
MPPRIGVSSLRSGFAQTTGDNLKVGGRGQPNFQSPPASSPGRADGGRIRVSLAPPVFAQPAMKAIRRPAIAAASGVTLPRSVTYYVTKGEG